MFKLVHPRAWDPVVLHDWFNLFIIAVLNVENMTYLLTGKGFEVFFTSAMVYFLLDTIFVGVFPQSVKSPVVILSHHICTALYMLIPYNYPHYQWCMAYCMLVEINTWLLIARRTLGGKITEILFYVSWVLLRNIFYPYLIWAFYKEWQVETEIAGTPWNWIVVTPICQAFLTGLNYHWTLQLVFKVLQRHQASRVKGSGGVAKYSKHLWRLGRGAAVPVVVESSSTKHGTHSSSSSSRQTTSLAADCTASCGYSNSSSNSGLGDSSQLAKIE